MIRHDFFERPAGPSVLISDDSVVVCVTPDPKPQHSVGYAHAERSVRHTHANRKEVSDTLEMKRGMGAVFLEEFEILLGEFLDVFGERLKASPKIWRGVMLQSSVDVPLS